MINWDQQRREIEKIRAEYKQKEHSEREAYIQSTIKPYFQKKIQEIDHGLRGKPEYIQDKIWDSENGLMKMITSPDSSNEVKHGYMGELEFLQRKILIENIPVEILPEKQNEKLEGSKSGENQKNPDFKLILKEKGKELITEVKSPISDDVRRSSKLVRNANKQFKGSSLETQYSLPDEFKKFPDRTQGSLEIQYNDKHASILDEAGLKKLEKEIRKTFSPDLHRGVVQVRVYRDHQLVLELQRNRENQIIKTYPAREQEKGREDIGGDRNQRSQSNVLKAVMSQAKDTSKEVQKTMHQGKGMER